MNLLRPQIIAGLHQDSQASSPTAAQWNMVSDKQIQMCWERDKQSGRQTDMVEQCIRIFMTLFWHYVQVTLCNAENTLSQKCQTSSANSRLKCLQVVETQEAGCCLLACFFFPFFPPFYLFVCLFLCLNVFPLCTKKSTCFHERTQLHFLSLEFELMFCQWFLKNYCNLSWWRTRLWSGIWESWEMPAEEFLTVTPSVASVTPLKVAPALAPLVHGTHRLPWLHACKGLVACPYYEYYQNSEIHHRCCWKLHHCWV